MRPHESSSSTCSRRSARGQPRDRPRQPVVASLASSKYVRLFRRRPRQYEELIERQLQLFAQENGELIREFEAELARYRRAGSETAEERFGDVQDVAEEGRDALERIREAYAVTLEEAQADEYRFAFDRRAVQRYPRFALDLDFWSREDD